MSSRKIVLVAEDEELLAENLKTYLQKAACEVRLAGDGPHAVALAQQQPPDLLLADYKLPGLDGLGTIAHIGRRHRHCGCVLMSGHLSPNTLVEARILGVRRVLMKPFGLGELARILKLPPQELVLAPGRS